MLRCMEKIKLMGTGKLDYGDLFFHFRDTKSLDVLSLLSSIIDFQCTFTHHSTVQKWESYSTKWHCFVPMVIGLQGETVEIHITYLGRIAFKNRGLGPKYLLRILILRMLSFNCQFPLRESQIGPWLENYYLFWGKSYLILIIMVAFCTKSAWIVACLVRQNEIIYVWSG